MITDEVLYENIDYEILRASRNIAKYEKLRKENKELLGDFLLEEITQDTIDFYRVLYTADMLKRVLLKQIENQENTETFLRVLSNKNGMMEDYISQIRKEIKSISKKKEKAELGVKKPDGKDNGRKR